MPRAAPVRFAPLRFAPWKFAAANLAPVRFAPVRSAMASLAYARCAPVRSAPLRSAEESSANRRRAPERSAPKHRVVEVRSDEVRACKIRADQINLCSGDVAFLVPAPDHGDGGLHIGTRPSLVFPAGGTGGGKSSPEGIAMETASTSGRVRRLRSRPSAPDSGHCSCECSRMNAVRTSITVGWSLAESRAMRSSA